MSKRQDFLFDDLPADTSIRFDVVAGLIRARASKFLERPTLLDVGGHPGTFARRFSEALPRWKCTTVDTVEDRLDGYTIGSALDLPFEDDSFDVVTSIDVLEHISPRNRSLFLSELCRVCRSTVIIAAPFHHETTARLESLLDNSHKNVLGTPHPWLNEHVVNGLPKFREIFEAMPRTHGIVEAVKNYSLSNWLTWQILHLAKKSNGDLDKGWPAFDEAQVHAPECGADEIAYRTVLVAEKGEPTRIRPADLSAPSDAGDHLVEGAKLYCHLVELAGQPRGKPGPGTEIPAINERLQEALLAAEKEIGDLRKNRGGHLGRFARKLHSITRLREGGKE